MDHHLGRLMQSCMLILGSKLVTDTRHTGPTASTTEDDSTTANEDDTKQKMYLSHSGLFQYIDALNIVAVHVMLVCLI